MVWGALLGGLGSLVGYDANSQENKKQGRDLERYKEAFNQWSGYGDQENNSLVNSLSGISHDRYANYGNIGAQLNGQGFAAAGDQGAADYTNRLNTSLGQLNPMMAANRGNSAIAGKWRALANQRYAPRLQSQKDLVTQAGRTQGSQNFQQGLYDQAAESDVNLGRKTGEAQRRAGLLEAFRNRKLGADAMRFNYAGPSNSYYNSQLAGQLLTLAGNGVSSYRGGGGTVNDNAGGNGSGGSGGFLDQ